MMNSYFSIIILYDDDENENLIYDRDDKESYSGKKNAITLKKK